jgi:hypothetical protein
MNTFLFQARTDRYDLRSELKQGGKETWQVSRYWHAMRPRDIVYLWLAGPEDIRGIYGWGRIEGRPKTKGSDTTVDVRVEAVFATPLLAVDIRRDPKLAKMLILRAPQATNFLLSEPEAKQLAALALRQGESPPADVRSGRTPLSPRSRLRNRVFISYSHKNQAWLERLQVHLAPLARTNRQLLWDDTRIAPGKTWKTEIEEAMASAKVAVLLVSADFLASEFIMDKELPRLLAAASNEGAVILPVIVSPCRFNETSTLSPFQSVNSPKRPLCAMDEFEREDTFYRVSVAVEAALEGVHRGHD